MDGRDLELHMEEMRKNLIDLRSETDSLHTRLDGILKVAVDNPVEKVEVHGTLEVNTEKEVAISNIKEFSDDVQALGERIGKAIENSKPEKITSVEVSNLKEAKADEVTIKNFEVWADEVKAIVRAVRDIEPVFNIEKQVIEWPTSPKKPIPVRLSDGKGFYNALTAAFSGGMSTAGLATDAKLEEVKLAIQALDPSATPVAYIKRFAEVGDTTYIGYAVTTGAVIATSDSVWQIRKATDSGIFYADGEETFDKIWDNRASLEYYD